MLFIGENAIFDSDLFKLLMDFDEIATSDPNQKIHFYVYMYEGILKGKLSTSEEIESFLWYDSTNKKEILSNTLKNEIIPYCLKKGLIK